MHQQPLSTISRTERFSANCLSYQQNEPMSCWNLSGSPKLGMSDFLLKPTHVEARHTVEGLRMIPSFR
jgi:hypothetical protein